MLSNYLKEYFKERKISQYEIAKRVNMDRSKLNLSLNGKRKLTAEELLIIASEFDLDLNKIKEIKKRKSKKILNLISINA